jgi:hypothetical protein
MHRLLMGTCLGAVLLAGAAGCGSITPTGLLMKGGSWLAQEAIKKEFKHLKDKGKREEGDLDHSDRSRRPAEKSRRHGSRRPGSDAKSSPPASRPAGP